MMTAPKFVLEKLLLYKQMKMEEKHQNFPKVSFPLYLWF